MHARLCGSSRQGIAAPAGIALIREWLLAADLDLSDTEEHLIGRRRGVGSHPRTLLMTVLDASAATLPGGQGSLGFLVAIDVLQQLRRRGARLRDDLTVSVRRTAIDPLRSGSEDADLVQASAEPVRALSEPAPVATRGMLSPKPASSFTHSAMALPDTAQTPARSATALPNFAAGGAPAVLEPPLWVADDIPLEAAALEHRARAWEDFLLNLETP